MQNYAGKTWKELHKTSNNDWSIPIKAIEHLILVNVCTISSCQFQHNMSLELFTILFFSISFIGLTTPPSESIEE